MNFTTPIYESTFNKKYVFAEYADLNNFWIEVSYYINRDNFVSRYDFDSPVWLDENLKGVDGKKIFENSGVDFSLNYFLLKEEVEVVNTDRTLYRVTETYGYCPNKEFSSSGRIVVSRFGVADDTVFEAQALPRNSDLWTYDWATNEITMCTVNLDSVNDGGRLTAISAGNYSSSDFATPNVVSGDSCMIIAEGYSRWYDAFSVNFTIKSVDLTNNTITFYAPDITYYESDSNKSGRYLKDWLLTGDWEGKLSIARIGDQISSSSEITSYVSKIRYYKGLPSVKTNYYEGGDLIVNTSTNAKYIGYSRLYIKDARAKEAKVLTNYTYPNIDLWNYFKNPTDQYVYYYCPHDPVLEKIEGTDIWKEEIQYVQVR